MRTLGVWILDPSFTVGVRVEGPEGHLWLSARSIGKVTSEVTSKLAYLLTTKAGI